MVSGEMRNHERAVELEEAFFLVGPMRAPRGRSCWWRIGNSAPNEVLGCSPGHLHCGGVYTYFGKEINLSTYYSLSAYKG